MRLEHPAVVALLLLVTACASTPEPAAPSPPPPPLGDRIRVFDSAGLETDLDRLIRDVASADAVFLGETHIDDVTHQVEVEVLRGLIERTGGKVVLSMEMFERDAQPHLDRYLAGDIDEATFLAHARPWGNYRTGYRPLVELAKSKGVPVIGANFPAPLRRKIRGQKEQWDALTAEERNWVPRELFPNSAAYWKRVDRATRGHMGSAPARSPDERLYDGQNLWDNAMGEAVADALQAYPAHVVLHVVGGFHVQNRDGTVVQTARRAPEADLRVVNVWPQFDLMQASGAGMEPAVGDYVVYTASRARDRNEGRWAVEVGGDLRYQIRVPATATDAAPAPILVWLGDDGARDSDGLRYWTLALGDEAAIVSIDPLHLSEEDDLRLGGRWYWTDSFTSDASRVQRGLERVVDYVSRRFPVDPDRVVVAGRGTGATAVLWAAMYTDALKGVLIAAEPRRTGRLRMAGLPAQKSSIARLRAVTVGDDADAFRAILKDYTDLGLETDLVTVERGQVLQRIEAEVRASLGLPEPEAAAPAARAATLAVATPTAARWAELYARSSAARGAPVRLADAGGGGTLLDIGGVWNVADLQRPGALPTAPGPFGGTTVLVVPAGQDAAAREAWAELLANDPLKKRSRFHRMVLAFEEGGPFLSETLRELKAARRKNVLIVPARFCATGDQMRAIRAAAEEALDGMTVHWLPGLGGRLATLGPR